MLGRCDAGVVDCTKNAVGFQCDSVKTLEEARCEGLCRDAYDCDTVKISCKAASGVVGRCCADGRCVVDGASCSFPSPSPTTGGAARLAPDKNHNALPMKDHDFLMGDNEHLMSENAP